MPWPALVAVGGGSVWTTFAFINIALFAECGRNFLLYLPCSSMTSASTWATLERSYRSTQRMETSLPRSVDSHLGLCFIQFCSYVRFDPIFFFCSCCVKCSIFGAKWYLCDPSTLSNPLPTVHWLGNRLSSFCFLSVASSKSSVPVSSKNPSDHSSSFISSKAACGCLSYRSKSTCWKWGSLAQRGTCSVDQRR